MDYDFRNRAGAASPYPTQQIPMYRQSSPPMNPSSHPMYGYPKVGQPGHTPVTHFGRQPSHHQTPSSSPPSSSSSGLGIRVTLKPEYGIAPPPQLSPLIVDIPRANFRFDFELERKILAEAEKESPNWSMFGRENLPSRPPERISSVGSAADPVVSKYIASGLSREAVSIAVANYGDSPSQVQQFVKGYSLMREMGFPSKNVTEALLMYDNDEDKALAHFLNNS